MRSASIRPRAVTVGVPASSARSNAQATTAVSRMPNDTCVPCMVSRVSGENQSQVSASANWTDDEQRRQPMQGDCDIVVIRQRHARRQSASPYRTHFYRPSWLPYFEQSAIQLNDNGSSNGRRNRPLASSLLLGCALCHAAKAYEGIACRLGSLCSLQPRSWLRLRWPRKPTSSQPYSPAATSRKPLRATSHRSPRAATFRSASRLPVPISSTSAAKS